MPIKPVITLPQPFDWRYIPEGQVTLTPDAPSDDLYITQNMLIPISAFWMAKYPITNAHYREFINNDGYQNDQWWTGAGTEQRKIGEWTKPYYWDDPQWNGDDYPVVGVSWYEAVAFCNWLSHKTGKKITLPSDAQWQRAIQGDITQRFVWGDNWRADLCNNSVIPHKSTHITPVYHYEGKSDSPFGVVDMTGNVWEWCLTTYYAGSNEKEGVDVRVLRGGSWCIVGENWFTTTFRSAYYPDGRKKHVGFRIACL